MLNQLIHIPSRYAGLITDGCLIDGLTVLVGVFIQHYERYLGGSDGFTSRGNSTRTTMAVQSPLDRGIGWMKRWQRMQHWHSFPHCLQLHQG